LSDGDLLGLLEGLALGKGEGAGDGGLEGASVAVVLEAAASKRKTAIFVTNMVYSVFFRLFLAKDLIYGGKIVSACSRFIYFSWKNLGAKSFNNFPLALINIA
jgi:hypothetical protein